MALPWVVSARSPEALRAQAGQLATFIDGDAGPDPVDVAYSLATTRALFEHRAVVVADSRESFAAGLDALARGETPPNVIAGSSAGTGRLAFLFTGQGSQRVGMGRQLHGRYPVYAEAFDTVCAELDRHLAGYVDHKIRDVVFATGDTGILHRTVFTQTALFAVEVALFRLLESWGIRPDFLAGHSIGELTAAHVAGVLTLPDAATLVAARARLMQALPSGGAMIAIQAGEEEMLAALADHENRVGIAAVNGPGSIVISGDEEHALRIADTFEGRGRKTRRLRVSHAFHSSRMDGMLDEFRRIADGLSYAPPVIPIISNLTGEIATAEELGDTGYWTRHVRHTVRFSDGVRRLEALGVTTYLELGPDGVLTAMAQESLTEQDGRKAPTLVPVLRRDRPEPVTVITALGHARIHGVAVEWEAVFAGLNPQRVELPTYAFQHRRYWLDSSQDTAGSADRVDRRDLVDARFWETVERQDLDGLAATLSIPDPERRTSLGAVLPALASWWDERRVHATVDSWRYRVVWRAVRGVSTDGRVPGALSGTWLLVIPDSHTGTERVRSVSRALADRGAYIHQIVVSAADSDRQRLAAHLGETRDGAGTSADRPVVGVLSLLALAEEPHPVHAAVPWGAAANVALIQALDDSGVSAPLWFATSGAVSTGPSDPVTNPLQALLWGLGGILAAESPGRWGGVIDLPATADEQVLAQVTTALGGLCDETEVAVRPSGLLARRLVRAPLDDAPRAGGWEPRGTVAITGGTGALGGHVARWLAGNGAEHLLLISRRGREAPGSVGLEAELNALGAKVTIAACDVADRGALADVLASVPAAYPLTAVVHTAAVLDDALLSSLTTQQMDRVLRVKAQGALNLHELTREMELSAFVLFSSLAGVCGIVGQGNYAPGNAFLDALADHRRAHGLVATSIAWGHWGGDGIADPDISEQFRRHGLSPMAPELAVTALGQALDHEETNLVICEATWETFFRTRRNPLLSELTEIARTLREADGDDAAEPADATSESLIRQLTGVPDSQQRQILLTLVRTQVAAVQGHASGDAVDIARTFRDQGFDSLTAVEFRNRLSAATGLRLPTTVVFDHPSPATLVDHLRSELLSRANTTVPAVLSSINTLESSLSSLSADEPARAAIAARLQELAAVWSGGARASGAAEIADALSGATDDELISFIGNELGIS